MRACSLYAKGSIAKHREIIKNQFLVIFGMTLEPPRSNIFCDPFSRMSYIYNPYPVMSNMDNQYSVRSEIFDEIF